MIAGACSSCGGDGRAFDELLSPSFRLSEFLQSQTAVRHRIPNDPDATVRAALRALCVEMLQPMRDALGPVRVSSGYRSPRLNAAVGSSAGSAHVAGHAADLDLDVPYGQARDWLRGSGLAWDQMLHEGTWLHLGRMAPDGRQRKQVLRLDPRTGRGSPWL